MTEKKKGSWHGKKQVLLMIYLGILLLVGNSITGSSTNTVIPYISASNGWNQPLLVTIAGLSIIMGAIFSFGWGVISQRKGGKFSIIVALFIGAASIILYGLTKNIAWFIVAIVLNALATAGYKESGALVVTTNWWPRTKGLALGWITIGIPLTTVIYEPYMTSAYDAIGFQTTEILIAVIMVILAIIAIIFVKNTPEQAGEYPDGDSNGLEDLEATAKAIREYKSPFTTKKLLSMKVTWFIAIGMGMFWLTGACFICQLVPYLLTQGYDFAFCMPCLSICGIAGIPGSYIFGLLDQKLGTKKAAFIYLIVANISFILGFFAATTPVFPYICGILFLGSMGGVCNLIPSMIGTVFGRWDFPAANRIIYPITNILSGIGISMSGIFSATIGFRPLFIVCFVLNIVSFIIITRIPNVMIGKKEEDSIAERA